MARDELIEPRATEADYPLEPPPDRAPGSEDGEIAEPGLRPRTLAEFVGQRELKERLRIILEAARRRGAAADHLLFAGPPGLGKTTLAGIVATEVGSTMQVTSGPALERAGDLAAILTKIGDGDVLFIDEIHRLPRAVEEVLYPAIEDFQLDIVLGKGPAARSIRLDLPEFTLVGATTRTGLITGPLRDRFGLVARLDYYESADLQSIVERTATIIEAPLSTEGAREIARARRALPTGCCAACATTPTSRPTATSTPTWPSEGWRCSASTTWDSTRWTGRSSTRSFGVSPVGRSGCRPWRSRWPSQPRRWRTFTNRSSSNRAC